LIDTTPTSRHCGVCCFTVLTEPKGFTDMKILTVDTETYFDSEYSPTKIPTDEYISDSKFQLLGFCLKLDDGPCMWFENSEDDSVAKTVFARVPWDEVAVVCHNTLFDGFILTQRYGVRPKLWMDTLAMSRMLWPWKKSHGLAAMSKELGLPDKQVGVLAAAKGKRLADFIPAEISALGEYCRLDAENTYALAIECLRRTPPIELKLIDMTVRMFTEPQLVGDVDMMRNLLTEEVQRKANLLSKVAVDSSILQSNVKLATELKRLGAVPPTKISPRTGNTTWAFARTDAAFEALLEHENPEVQALVAARLGIKSTIAETRCMRMLKTAERGALPVYLNYWGAKTTGRYSGGNQINWQNIPVRGPSAGLRHAIKAPPGHKVIAVDSSNIELRVAMAGSGQINVLEKIANGDDLYCDFASRVFGRTITKADERERRIGKIGMLSLQYGAGWMKYKEMVRIETGEILGDDEARRVVELYRTLMRQIVRWWGYCETAVLAEIFNNLGSNFLPVDANSWCITGHSGFGVLGAPGVVYRDLRRDADGWLYTMNDVEDVKLYGGKVVENFCQHVARQIVMWQTLQLNEAYPVALSVHDEAVIVVADADVADATAYAAECFTLAPPWCTGQIPLACEVGVGQSYGEC
jgi:DNA polymerase I-like protein with 3'-5' exonuclease and polymerase domains